MRGGIYRHLRRLTRPLLRLICLISPALYYLPLFTRRFGDTRSRCDAMLFRGE